MARKRAPLKLLRKKRTAALVLLVLLLLLFYKSGWILKLIYPIHYREQIEASSSRFGVDPLLVAAIIRVETNYKPEIRSHKGAIGIMQLMPDTAEWIFERDGFQGYSLEDLDDPAKNIQVGSQYIELLSRQFRTQAEIIAAYNAGQGNVLKWRQANIWDGTLEHVEKIPYMETRKYVDRVSYYYHKYVSIYGDEH